MIIILSKRYIAHRYVLEQLKTMELQESQEQLSMQKTLKEKQFDDEIVEIQRKGATEKIQLIEENSKYAKRYKNRMYSHVDKYED